MKINPIKKIHVPIGSAPKTDLIDFHPYAPAIKYVQHENNICLFSILVSYLFDARENVAYQAVALRLELSFKVNHLVICIG